MRHAFGKRAATAFQAAGCDARHAVREVRRLELLSLSEAEIELVIEATAFVRHMVRNIAGTLVEVGLGRRSPASIGEVLASRDRTRAGRTAPPQGLVLEEVFYGGPSSARVSLALEPRPASRRAREGDDNA